MLTVLEQNLYCGPARVVRAKSRRLLVAMPGRRVWARIALVLGYQPAAGDTVLAIGQDQAWYVIGVLRARGDVMLSVPGNLELRAPHGDVDIGARGAITMQGSALRILARRVDLVAHTLAEKLGSAYRWVKDFMHVRAGHSHTIVQSTHRLKAERIVERADGDVHIDGRKIYLG
jgi:hypothetical protein